MQRYGSFLVGLMSVIDWLPYLSQYSYQAVKKSIILIIIFLCMRNMKVTKNRLVLASLLTTQLLYSFMLAPFSESTIPLTGVVSTYLVVFFILIIEGIDKFNFIVGFLSGILLSFIVMAATLYGVEIDHSGLHTDGMGDYFLTNRFTLASLGLTNKYNKMSYLFALSFLITLDFKIPRRSVARRSFLFLFLVGCLLAGGRGGLLLIIASITRLLFENNAISSRIILLSIIGVACLFMDDISMLFMSRNARMEQWIEAKELIGNNLVFGYGYGPIMGREYSYFHNFFISGLYQGGIVGLILRILLFFVILYAALKSKLISHKMPLIVFVIIQCIFEDFNPLRIGTSYLIFWFLIYKINDKDRDRRGLLVN